MKRQFLYFLLLGLLAACGSDNKAPEPDVDGDTIPDARDNCIQIENADQINTDGDSAGDACDAFPENENETKDFDGDGLGDNQDLDDDNDNVNDDLDLYPYDQTEWEDKDGDQIPDNKDLHLESTSPNDIQLQRLLDTGKAVRFIAPGPRSRSESWGRHFGARVKSAGDINDDGFDDLLIGYGDYQDGDIYFGGIVYLLFGQSAGWPNTIDMNDLDSININYLEIHAVPGEDNYTHGTGLDVTAVGDVNKDGYDDFVFGSPYTDYLTNIEAGEVFLVFGREAFPKKIMTTVEIRNDYAITYYGKNMNDLLGVIVTSAGDMNGDTYPDILIGDLKYDLTVDGDEGRSIIIFGGSDLKAPIDMEADNSPVHIDLETLSSNKAAFINNTPLYLREGNARIQSIGDFNLDGYDDLTIARKDMDLHDGQVAVVYGKPIWDGPVDIDALGVNEGFTIKPSSEEDDITHFFGFNLAIGDVNGNGHQDLIISSLTVNHDDSIDENRVYILNGGRQVWPSTLYAAEMPVDMGTYIRSNQLVDFGHGVGVLPDTNADGMDELLVAAPNSWSTHLAGIYKFNGRESWDGLIVDVQGEPEGFERIESFKVLDEAGENLSVVGDYNQDGLNEFIIDVPMYYIESEDQPSSEWTHHFYMVYGTSKPFQELGDVE